MLEIHVRVRARAKAINECKCNFEDKGDQRQRGEQIFVTPFKLFKDHNAMLAKPSWFFWDPNVAS